MGPPTTGDQHITRDYGYDAVLLTDSYGGTHEQQLAGYGQGNAASGPGFTVLSSLIVNAYLHKGYGAQIYLSYYKRLLLLAAL